MKQMYFRYGSLKAKMDYYKDCIKIAGDIILEKNPSIVSQMMEYNNNYKQTTIYTDYEDGK